MRPHAARRLFASFIILSIGCATTPVVSRMSDVDRAERRVEIEAMLEHAASNWNRGDLDAFVTDYLPGSETTYIGGRDLLRGPAAIRAAYAPRFASGNMHDSLSFQLMDIDPLAPDLLNVIATWQLTRRLANRDSVTGRGPTSLVMRRVDGRWRIVHDHSS